MNLGHSTALCVIFISLIYMICMCSAWNHEYMEFDQFTLLITWDKPTDYTVTGGTTGSTGTTLPVSQIAGSDLLNYDISVYQSTLQTLSPNAANAHMEPTEPQYISGDSNKQWSVVYQTKKASVSGVQLENTAGDGQQWKTSHSHHKEFFSSDSITLETGKYLHVFIRAYIEDGESGSIGMNDGREISADNLVLDRRPGNPKNIQIQILASTKDLEYTPTKFDVALATGSYSVGSDAEIVSNTESTSSSYFPYMLSNDMKNLLIKSGQEDQVQIVGLYSTSAPSASVALADPVGVSLFQHCALVYLGNFPSLKKHKYLRVLFKDANANDPGNWVTEKSAIMSRLMTLVEPSDRLGVGGVTNSNYDSSKSYVFQLYTKTEVSLVVPDTDTDTVT